MTFVPKNFDWQTTKVVLCRNKSILVPITLVQRKGV